MKSYDDNMVIADALQRYFSKYHFANGGYDLKWFRIKLGPLFIPLPNIPARVRAVKIHDIHHVITEYPATLKGEAEIGAWEIASGCGRYYVAWLLNFGAFFYGVLFFTKPVIRAFLNGRKCSTNFYHNVAYDGHLLGKTVGELRKEAGIGNVGASRPVDYLLFFCFSLVVLAAYAVFFASVFYLISEGLSWFR